MSATNATRSVTRDGGACLDFTAATIPPLTLSERFAARIGNFRAMRGGVALRAEFVRFCSRLYWRLEDRDPTPADEFRANQHRRLGDAGEREIVWTRE